MAASLGKRCAVLAAVPGMAILLAAGLIFQDYVLAPWHLYKLKSADKGERRAAAVRLARAGLAAEAVAPVLLEDFKSASESARSQTRSILVGLGSRAIPILMEFLKDKESWVRTMAINILGQTGLKSRQAATELIAFINDPDGGIRDAAIRAMVGFGPEALPLLAGALKSPSDAVRFEAGEILKRLSRDAIPTFCDALKNSNVLVRRQAAWNLGELGMTASEAARDLIGALQDPDPEVRWRAAWALGRMGEEAVIAEAALTRALEDREPLVRSASAWSIGNLAAGDASVARLTERLKDENPDVREKAGEAIERLLEKFQDLRDSPR